MIRLLSLKSMPIEDLKLGYVIFDFVGKLRLLICQYVSFGSVLMNLNFESCTVIISDRNTRVGLQ